MTSSDFLLEGFHDTNIKLLSLSSLLNSYVHEINTHTVIVSIFITARENTELKTSEINTDNRTI